MNIKLFLIIGLVLNTFVAILFPAELGLSDPLGLDAIRQQQFNETGYFTEEISNTYTNESIGFFTTDGNIKKIDKTIENVTAMGKSGDQFFISDVSGFGFLDWVRVALNFIQSVFIFMIAPIMLMYQMPYPFNVMFGLPYSLLYLASIIAFALGR